MADDSGKQLKHADLEKFVSDTLSKREPCPAMVLAWGWLMKAGEGGLFHGDSYKQRFFVLARVPHATVLIYYGERTMDEDNILGYIDLRKVQAVREGSKSIVVDAPKSGLMSKLFARGGAPTALTRGVVELVTAREVGRVYNLAPATIQMPAPMTSAAALANAAGSKPLYLFGWPFPVPAIDEVEEEKEVAEAFAEGRLPEDNFAQWRDVLATAVAAEKATHTYPVATLVDSTGQLPQRVYLRTTPCELAIVSMEDKDLCYAALPYNDLIKWECPVESEIHVTARTRARLVAKPDRSGFSSQRPTRSTCHFVFKCTQAKAIVSVIDNHLRALAKQLANLGDGADEAEVAAAALGEASLEEEEGEAAAAAAPAPAPAKKKAAPAPTADEEDDEPPARSKKAAGKAATSSRGAAKADSGSEDEEKPAKKPAAAAKKASSRAAAKEDSGSEEEEKPAKKTSSSKKAARAKDDSEEEEAPKPKSSRTSSKKSTRSEEEEEEEAPKKKAKSPRDDSEEEEAPKKKAKSPRDESEEEEEPKKSVSRKKSSRKAAEDSD